MEDMKKCPFCGGEISIDAKKCRHCGEWLEKKPTTDWMKSINLSDDVSADGTRKPSKFCKWWYIANSLFLLIPALFLKTRLNSAQLKYFGRHKYDFGFKWVLFPYIVSILAIITIVLAFRSNKRTNQSALICSIFAIIGAIQISVVASAENWNSITGGFYTAPQIIGGILLLIFSLLSIKANKSK
jgi:hypothetical protein